MMPRKVYQAIAETIQALWKCQESVNEEWCARHRDRIKTLCDAVLPHGSGFDNGSEIDLDRSKPERLVFTTAFHHMDPNGHYDGWTDHTVIVTPSLVFGFELRVTGRNRDEIKDHIHECFHYALGAIEPTSGVFGPGERHDAAERTDLPESEITATQ